jgi:hypothetical protein
MVNETQYATPWSQRSPYVPEVDTLVVLQRNGNARIRMNRLEDHVVEANMAFPTVATDVQYNWDNFRLMIESEYGDLLQPVIDANPITEGETSAAWWTRITNIWLVNYFAAHNNPTNLLDGWEGPGGDYTPPENEPIAGFLPSE